MHKSPRKYFTEFALNIYSAEPALVTPADLDKLANESAEVKAQLKSANIYLILKRPRIAFIPSSLSIDQREVVGELAIQLNDSTPTFPFRIQGQLPEEVAGVRATYPYTKLTFVSASGKALMIYPMAYLLRYTQVELNGLDDQEVVYVGQAFGVAGERTAVERLSSHSTLQKILADISANEPHLEVLLALYSFDFHRFFMSGWP